MNQYADGSASDLLTPLDATSPSDLPENWIDIVTPIWNRQDPIVIVQFDTGGYRPSSDCAAFYLPNGQVKVVQHEPGSPGCQLKVGG